MTTNNAINLSAAGVVSYDGAGVFTGSILTLHSPLIGGASNAIVSLGPLTDGQLVIGSTGVDPVPATLTAGSGISIVNAGGSITISSSGGAGIASWIDVVGTTQLIANETGYVPENVALTTFTLPTTAAFGTVFALVGQGVGGWTIVQGTGQYLVVGLLTSTVGAGGSVSSTFASDSIEFLCTVADTGWTMRSSSGNLTVV